MKSYPLFQPSLIQSFSSFGFYPTEWFQETLIWLLLQVLLCWMKKRSTWKDNEEAETLSNAVLETEVFVWTLALWFSRRLDHRPLGRNCRRTLLMLSPRFPEHQRRRHPQVINGTPNLVSKSNIDDQCRPKDWKQMKRNRNSSVYSLFNSGSMVNSNLEETPCDTEPGWTKNWNRTVLNGWKIGIRELVNALCLRACRLSLSSRSSIGAHGR